LTPLALRASRPSPAREEGLSAERGQPAVVVVDVERGIGDDRRQADRSADVGLALKGTRRRIDVDDHAGRAGDDQAAAGEDRARIFDLAALRLGFLELRELIDPADVPVTAR